MTRTLRSSDSNAKRGGIVRDWNDGFTVEASAAMRKCSVEWVMWVREEERQRRIRMAKRRWRARVRVAN